MKFLTTAMCRSLSCRSLYYSRHLRLRFQFCLQLVLLSFAIGVSSKGDEPLSVAECIKAIQTFEKLCEGKTYFIESQDIGHSPGRMPAGRRMAVSTTRNHQYTNVQVEDFVRTITARDGHTTYPQHDPGSETVVAGGKVLRVYAIGSLLDIFDLDKKTEFTNERSFDNQCRIDFAGNPINSIGGESVWNGVSPEDGELFSKLVLSPASTSSARWIADEEGFTGTEFSALVPQQGTYLFWIDNSPHRRVVRIEITKRTGDTTSYPISPAYEVPVGSPPNYELLWRSSAYSEEQKRTIVDSYEREAREKGVVSKIHSSYSIQYEQGVSEPSLPISIRTDIKVSSDKSLHRHNMSLVHRIGEVRKFDFRGTNKLVFQRYKLPDRFPVRVVDRPGLDYEYRNGDIVRVIDTSTIVQHGENELPVRKHRWSATTWMGLVFAILFVISLVAIIIRQRRA